MDLARWTRQAARWLAAAIAVAACTSQAQWGSVREPALGTVQSLDAHPSTPAGDAAGQDGAKASDSAETNVDSAAAKADAAPTVCAAPGDGAGCKPGGGACLDGYLAIDVDGKTVCAPDFPVWGLRPLSPGALLIAAGDGTVRDTQTQLTWQQGFSPTPLDWNGAKAYCNGLNLAGVSDWRLPTEAEQQTLIDYGKGDHAVAGAFAGTPAEWFWSAGTLQGSPGDGWLVFFGPGISYSVGVGYKNRARCVRNVGAEPQLSASARFQPHAASGTVHDLASGRTWQRDGSASGVRAWSAATAYCAKLQLDGGGWRLPDVVELLSLVNRQALAPSSDGVAFPGTPPAGYWSASLRNNSSQFAWYVDFDHGYSGSFSIDNGYHVRCVR